MDNNMKGSKTLMKEEYRLASLAREGKLAMIAIITRDVINEDSKENPNKDVIARLETEIRKIEEEEEQAYGNKELMQKFIDQYAPIIRERITKASSDE